MEFTTNYVGKNKAMEKYTVIFLVTALQLRSLKISGAYHECEEF